jgi:hypothetical protein
VTRVNPLTGGRPAPTEGIPAPTEGIGIAIIVFQIA